MSEINYDEMLHQDTVFLDIDANNSDQLFEQVGAKLKELGYAKDSYVDALKKRERRSFQQVW